MRPIRRAAVWIASAALLVSVACRHAETGMRHPLHCEAVVVRAGQRQAEPVASGEAVRRRQDRYFEQCRFARYQSLRTVMAVLGPIGRAACRINGTVAPPQPAFRQIAHLAIGRDILKLHDPIRVDRGR